MIPCKAFVTMLVGTVLLGAAAEPAPAQQWITQGACTSLNFEEVWFTSPQDGWIVGGSGTILRTVDGQGWFPVPLTDDMLHDVSFRDPTVGLVVGDNGSIFRTVNGGDSWTSVESATAASLRAVAFGTDGRAYAGGLGVLLTSADDGAVWSITEAGDFQYLDAAAQGPDHAWMVGGGGSIRATTNGGATWFSQSSETTDNLEGVHFVTPSEGWIAGPNGILKRTQDGGATWTLRNGGIGASFRAVHFVESSQGWAVGAGGAIYHTTNGGLDWAAEGYPSGVDDLDDVYFADADHGWAVGIVCLILFRGGTVAVPDLAPQPLSLRHQPNPVRHSATIEYALPQPGFVKLAVYDVRGRQVAIIVEGHKEPGVHPVEWRPEGLARGLYFYRYDALGSSVSTRFVLLQ